MADPLKNAVTVESLLPAEIVPSSGKTSADGKLTCVSLREVVGINGTNYGPGENCWVPTDAEPLWRNSVVKE